MRRWKKATGLALAVILAASTMWTSGQVVYAERIDENAQAAEINPIPVPDTEEDNREHILNDFKLPKRKPVESMSVRGKNNISLYRGGEEIPESWDWDDISGYMPDLRKQDPFGACWAISAMSMAEINLMKKGLASTANMSEVQLAYFSYNWETDPLGGTAGDDNKGLFKSISDNFNYLNFGGDISFAKNVLASWVGTAADEGELAYPEKKEDLKETLDGKYAYSYDQAHLQNCYEVILDKNRLINEGITNADMQAAKKLIKEKGAIGINYCSPTSIASAINNGYYNRQYNAFYDPYDHGGSNHNVVVVGWDDNFPSTNFTKTAPGNGAWLVRNSWTDKDYEESYSGYFWMSYYTYSIGEDAYAFDFDLAGKYDNNYQYDGSWVDTYIPIEVETFQGANVFQTKASEAGEELKAVSFYTYNSNAEYEVNIYTSDSPMSSGPVVGTSVATKTGTVSCPGYYTVALDSPVDLGKDQYFSVVVSIKKPNGRAFLGAEMTDTIAGFYKCIADKGQEKSYLYYNSQWHSLESISGLDACGNFRIKAFTDNKVTTPSDLNEASVSIDTLTYTGSPRKPLVTVKNSGGTVINSEEYTLEYSNNINAGNGTGRVVVKAKDGSTKCTGSKTVSFSIAPANIGKTIRYYIGGGSEVYADNVRYEGYEACIPLWELARRFILKNKGATLTEGTDYEYIDPEKNTFFDISESMDQSYYITGKGNYKGTKEVPLGFEPIDIEDDGGYYPSLDGSSIWWSGAEISPISDQVLSTSAEGNTPELTVTNKTRGKLTAGKDYTVTYSNNKAVGTATATITGKGNYTGTKSAEFKIVAKSDPEPEPEPEPKPEPEPVIKPEMTLNTSGIIIQTGKSSSKVKASLVNDAIASVVSSNDEVASVTFSGDTITVKAGKTPKKATVIVTSKSGIVRKFTVTVQKERVTTQTLTLNKKKVSLDLKKTTAVVKVKATPGALSTGEPVIIKMAPAAKRVATAEYDETTGLITITAKATGTAKIKVCAGKMSEYVKATVKLPVNVKKVKLNKKKIIFTKIGETRKLEAVITPSNSSNKKVTWKSSDTKVAKVNKNGKVTAVAAGTATITVTTKDGSKTANCVVTVTAGKKK